MGRPAASFDVWHTLIYLDPDSEEEYYRAQVALATEAVLGAGPIDGHPTASEAEIREAVERTFAEATAAANEGRSVGPGEQLLRAAARAHGRPDPGPYLLRLDELVLRQPFRPAPGAAELLSELRAEGWTLVAVGNTVGERGVALRRVLHRLGLAEPFHGMFFSDEMPWAKPAPEIFWRALEHADSLPESAVHVGDSWSDIEGARRAGLRAAIWFTGLQEYGPHYRSLNLARTVGRADAPLTARNMREVRQLLRELPILPAPGDAHGSPRRGLLRE